MKVASVAGSRKPGAGPTMAWHSLITAQHIPMPPPSESTATTVNPGALASTRMA